MKLKHKTYTGIILLIFGTFVPKYSYSQSTSAIIQEVVNYKTLGDNVSYVEGILGVPARRTNLDPLGYTRSTYELGRCVVEIGSKDGKVASVKTNIVAGLCDPEVSLDVNRNHPYYVSQTTYSDWSRRGDIFHFISNSFAQCNACGDSPFPTMYTIGNGGSGYFDIAIGSTGETRTRGVYADASPWFDALKRAGVNTRNLPYERSDCPLQRASDAGIRAMGSARVGWIEIGERGAVQPACNPLTAIKNVRGEYLGRNQ